MISLEQCIQKYNLPVPRYTSYPTVPHWHTQPSPSQWASLVKTAFQHSNQDQGISLYIHLPYCSSLCTYCGCNTRITTNHAVELPYIQSLLQEWQLYLRCFEGQRPILRELHLGGGTPTFFQPENLFYLLSNILATVDRPAETAWSFEGHPNSTSFSHLQVLYDLGFRRMSLGIQDFDPKVQEMINRYQTLEQVAEVTAQARAIGYESINYDLIYGLPLQTLHSVQATIAAIAPLRPGRIAFYSYAHVPWLKPGQRKYTEADLPSHEAKRALYELGYQMLLDLGYEDIGMDHFALPQEALAIARRQGRLHRNFMGYTTQDTQLLIGLGASAIGDTWTGFAQNLKKVEDYQAAVAKGEFPLFNGHILSEQDLFLRPLVLELMCQESLHWTAEQAQNPSFQRALSIWREQEKDGLLELHPQHLSLRPRGRAFLRNIAAALDDYYQQPKLSEKPQFSAAI
jgi:oxygen-independent coproporphyrinogen-3 oxidase